MNSETKNDLMTETDISNTEYASDNPTSFVPRYNDFGRIALMVFLIVYTIFEVPPNTFLKHMGPSKWFALLLCCWSTVSMCLGAVQNYAGITAVRFMLGVFEAGLAPGLAYHISFWYRANERSVRLAYICSTATLAGAFGMPS